MPKFGPRKVGQAEFERSKIKEKMTSKFGPRKFGKRKAAEMDAQLAVADAAVEEEKAVEPALVTEPGKATATSIKQIDQALKENPVLYEELYQLELERPDGGRKGAFRIFMAMEMALEGGPRDERLAELENLVKPKK